MAHLNPDDARAQQHRWYEQNRSHRMLTVKEWQSRNPERRRAISRRSRQRLREDFLWAYGGKCQDCGESDPDVLTLDHIGGGGHDHKRRVNGGVYSDLKKAGWPKDRYALVCANCNIRRYRRQTKEETK